MSIVSTTIIENSRAANILQQMWEEAATDQFSDVVLIAGVEEIKIPAHRAILSRATAYFKGMFTSFRESREKEIKINEVDGNALKSLIQFIYTGRLEIMEDNVQGLLEAADMLLLNDVEASCCNFLTEKLDVTNCLGFELLAGRCHCPLLKEYAREYSLEHFMDVYQTQEFLKLNAEQLGQLLASDNINVTSEEEVFNSLLLWLEHDGCEREKYMDDLLKLVRMPLLEPKFLDVHVRPVCKSTESRQLYIDVKEWHSSQGRSALNPIISIKPRRSLQYLIGITVSKRNNNMRINFYCPHQLRWKRWMNNLEYRAGYAVAAMGHNIYLAGGANRRETILNTVLCLNMKTMTFSPVNAMTEHRKGCSAAVLNGVLYVAGGSDGRSDLRSVERWDPKINVWNIVASMSFTRCNFEIAELNKKLYAVGGNLSGTRGTAEYFDPDRNVWTSIASMSEMRFFNQVAVANGLLYAVGGWGSKTIERYDSVTNQWSNISSLRESLPAYVHSYSCASFHDKVVVCYKDRVEEYDATTNEWKTNESLKGLPKGPRILSYSDELLISAFF